MPDICTKMYLSVCPSVVDDVLLPPHHGDCLDVDVVHTGNTGTAVPAQGVRLDVIVVKYLLVAKTLSVCPTHQPIKANQNKVNKSDSRMMKSSSNESKNQSHNFKIF